MVRKELLSFCFLKNWTSAFNLSWRAMQLHFVSSQEISSLYQLAQRQLQPGTQTLPLPRQCTWGQSPPQPSSVTAVLLLHHRRGLGPSLSGLFIGGSQPVTDLVKPRDTPDGSTYKTEALRLTPGSSCPPPSEPNWVIIDNQSTSLTCTLLPPLQQIISIWKTSLFQNGSCCNPVSSMDIHWGNSVYIQSNP